MAYQPKGTPPKNRVFLVCDRGRTNAGCDRSYSVRYDEFEETILSNCSALRPEAVLDTDDVRSKECDLLRSRISSAQGRLEALDEEIDNFESLAGRLKDREAQDAYEAKARERRKERAETQKTLTADAERLREAELDRVSVTKWTADLAALRKAIVGKGDEVTERRSALREHLSELIEQIEVFAHGFARKAKKDAHSPKDPPRTWPHASWTNKQRVDWKTSSRRNDRQTIADLGSWLEATLDEAQPPLSRSRRADFHRFFLDEQMSKRGRFFRVHFRTGIVHDFVPAGSIAAGRALVRSGEGKSAQSTLRFVSPPLDEVWAMMLKRRRPRLIKKG